MAAIGYNTWYHLPVRILGKFATKDIRLSNEKQVIAWLQPTLNKTKRVPSRIRSSSIINSQSPAGNLLLRLPARLTCYTVFYKYNPNPLPRSGPDLVALLNSLTG